MYESLWQTHRKILDSTEFGTVYTPKYTNHVTEALLSEILNIASNTLKTNPDSQTITTSCPDGRAVISGQIIKAMFLSTIFFLDHQDGGGREGRRER